MAAWKEVEQAEPEFAARVRRLFDAGRHKTIATLRADGSPRISGIECEFADGELRFGSMAGARKLADLQRDPHFALHGPTFHPEDGREGRSEEHTSELQSLRHLVCRLLLEKKKKNTVSCLLEKKKKKKKKK